VSSRRLIARKSGSFFLGLEDIRVLEGGTLLKEQGSYNMVQNRGHKGPKRVRTPVIILFYSDSQNICDLTLMLFRLRDYVVKLSAIC
jgi:hypothetical protein